MKLAKLLGVFLAIAGSYGFIIGACGRPSRVPKISPSIRLNALKPPNPKELMQMRESLASEFDITHLEALLTRYKRTVTHRFKGAIRAMRILEKPIKKGSVVEAQHIMERFYDARAQLWTDIQHYQHQAAQCLAKNDRPLALHYMMSAELLRFLDPVAKMASVYLYTAQNDDISKVERVLKAASIVGPSSEIQKLAEQYTPKKRGRKPKEGAAKSTAASAREASSANVTATSTNDALPVGGISDSTSNSAAESDTIHTLS